MKPVYQERIWGGKNLAYLFGRELSGDNIGESWELSVHPQGKSIVENGMWAGIPLEHVIRCNKEQIMGRQQVEQPNFPLLLKILDANEKLSVQVHPDDTHAARVHGDGQVGKTEAWYVLHAKEHAKIIYGLKPDITKQSLLKAMDDKNLLEAVNIVPVKAGDLIYIPAGTVHALLEGVVVYEVQQSSDLTYRLYDYDRKDQYGKLRELHVAHAIEVILDHQKLPADFNINKIQCPYFTLEIVKVEGVRAEATKDFWIAYFVIEGNGELIYNHGKEALRPGQTILIPACLEQFKIHGRLKMLRITL